MTIINKQLALNIEARAVALAGAGIGADDISNLVISDLADGGPIRTAYLKSLKTAARIMIVEKMRCGEADCHTALSMPRTHDIAKIKGNGIDYDGRVKKLKRLAKAIITATNNGEQALEREGFTNLIDFVWVAELKRTCPRCLPLHGSVLTLKEWKKRGKLPSIIHSDWLSVCHCRLIPNRIAVSLEEIIAPLKRAKIKGTSKTRRAIEVRNERKASKGADVAARTTSGRRALRELGAVNSK